MTVTLELKPEVEARAIEQKVSTRIEDSSYDHYD